MNLRSFRVQLAVALGLPLGSVACKGKPPEIPVDDGSATGSGSGSGSAGSGSGSGSVPVAASADGRCPVDAVHEFVCGLTDPMTTEPRAPAPYQACGVNAIPLVQFDDFLFIDSSKWGNHDPGLSTFRFDPDRTSTYHYGGTIDPGDTWCCYERCAPLAVTDAPRTAMPANLHPHEMCVPPPEAGPSAPAAAAPQCPVGMKLALVDDEPLDNAPFASVGDDGSCCYTVASTRLCPTDMYEDDHGDCQYPERGRPLREGGAVVVAPTTRRDGWRDATPALAGIDAAARAYAAGAWSREAAAEHASVAAFARLSIDLMVAGAPADLVDDAHVAARDEIRHATLAYGLATAFGGVPVGPGPLALVAGARATTLVTLVSECFLDGCVGETVAAMAAAEARARALPGAVRDALEVIADDEARHAALSFRIVAWALAAGGAPVRAQLVSNLELIRRELAAPAPTPGADPAGFDERLGVLAASTARAVRHRVLADIVVPCTEALLARRSDA